MLVYWRVNPHVCFHPHSPASNPECHLWETVLPTEFQDAEVEMCPVVTSLATRGAAKPTRDLHGWPRQKWGI